MSQVRTSYAAVASLGLGTFTLGLYFFAGRVSPFLAAVGMFLGLWGVHAIRRGVGRLNGYPLAASGILLGCLQFTPLLVPGAASRVSGVAFVRTT